MDTTETDQFPHAKKADCQFYAQLHFSTTLMISLDQLRPLLSPPETANESARISCIGIITCNRLPQLQRCLATYGRHLIEFNRNCEVLIADDSSNAGARAASREWLAVFARNQSIRVSYAGAEEKEQYAHRLGDAGIPLPIAQFALLNPRNVVSSPGANRNSLLLHTAGDLSLSCDDDSECFPGDLRRGDQSIAAVPWGEGAIDTHFVSTEAEALAQVKAGSFDVIGAHEQLLGRPIAELFLSKDGQPTRRFLPKQFVLDMIEKKGRVAVSLSGVLGDIGMPDCMRFMFATGALRDRFLRYWEMHGGPQTGRLVIRGVYRPTVSPKSVVMTTTATGLDNRLLLPPFPPWGGGEDTLFGMIAQGSLDGMYTGYVPVALLHSSGEQRTYQSIERRFTLGRVVFKMLEGYSWSQTDSTARKLKSVGRYLFDLASVRANDFEAYLSHIARDWRLQEIETCEWYLQKFNSQPSDWAAEIHKWVRQLELDIMSAHGAVPFDLRNGDNKPCILAQHAVSQLGQLLECWPDMLEAAAELRNSGVRIGKDVG